MRIAITGSRLYEDKRKVKELIFQLKQKFGTDLEIASGGTKDGIDRYAKKYSLDLGLQYLEYNPQYTQHNLYSRFSEQAYNKPYHVSQIHKRNDFMVKESDMLICFIYENESLNGIQGTIKAAKRYGKKYVIIT